MRQAIAGGLGLVMAVLLATAWLLVSATPSQLTEIRESRTRLDRLCGGEPRHCPPELVPPRAPGPGITG